VAESHDSTENSKKIHKKSGQLVNEEAVEFCLQQCADMWLNLKMNQKISELLLRA
jgi:hypothetical protein